jgi:hypothetical protein
VALRDSVQWAPNNRFDQSQVASSVNQGGDQ